MQNWKVSSRLLVAFGLVLLMLGVVLTVGIRSMGAIYDDLRIITEVNNKQIELASDMQMFVQERAIATRNIVLITDDAGMKEQVERLGSVTQEYNAAKAELGKMFAELKETIQEEKDAFSKIQIAEDKAIPLAKRVSELGLANKNDEATKVLMEELRPAQSEWINAIKSIVEIEQRLNDVAAKDAAAAYSSAKMLMLLLGAAAIALSIAAAVIITRSLTKQLGGEPSEVGRIAERIAKGDLTITVNTLSSDRTSVMYAMKEMRDSLVKIVGDVRVGTDTIATASSQIAAGNMDLSSRTEQQASSLEETASSMEELTSTVKQNADNARQANQLAVTASGVAVKGGEVVSQVVTTMESINESARKIVDIIGVIDGIAFQTNILALNAAVEAARAGEQGRGFAVVASEVRNLAQRSAAAAKEIKGLISDSVEKVDAGSKLVGQAGSTMQEIVNSVRSVTDVMAEIMAASQEQSAGIEQVNQAIGQMDQVTQQNAALVEEAAAAAESLQDQSANLAQVVSVFRLDGMQVVAAKPAAGPRSVKSSASMPKTRLSSGTSRRQAGAEHGRAPQQTVAAPATAVGGEWEEF